MRKVFWLLLIVIVVAGCWYVLGNRSANPPAAVDTGVTVGKKMPDLELKDLNGNFVRPGQAGKVTVLNFWATWCPPCRAEMPELQRFVLANAATADFYAVNIQEPAAKVAAFMQQNQYAIPVLLDGEGKVSAMFQINAVPTTIITDKNGVIRFRKSGGVNQSELEGIIKGL